jgi:hypothetical protein
MPLDLTDAELTTAATACRAMAYQEGERVRKMENPTVGGPLEAKGRRLCDSGGAFRGGAKQTLTTRVPTRRFIVRAPSQVQVCSLVYRATSPVPQCDGHLRIGQQ